MSPLGLVWDSCNYSCGYDATFTILGNLWMEDPDRWTNYFSRTGEYLRAFGNNMNRVHAGTLTFEQVRNKIRKIMHMSDPISFPNGPNGTAIDLIAGILLQSKCYGSGMQLCPDCGYADPHHYEMLEGHLSAGLNNRLEYPLGVPLQEWLNSYLSRGRSNCGRCRLNNVRTRMVMRTTINALPPVFIVNIDHDKLIFNPEIAVDCNGYLATMTLRGIIYGGQAHFTCRFVDRDGHMWFHDGITTGSRCLPEVSLRSVAGLLRLHYCGEKKAVAVIYARVG
ncbi:hypothetical protein B0H19DRAFT_952667 [Mycena capillaripes]|nr:hypothetical protein B0H19DRAFT_952667 [Mycena capillaripes]